jgi:hypothetical protein
MSHRQSGWPLDWRKPRPVSFPSGWRPDWETVPSCWFWTTSNISSMQRQIWRKYSWPAPLSRCSPPVEACSSFPVSMSTLSSPWIFLNPLLAPPRLFDVHLCNSSSIGRKCLSITCKRRRSPPSPLFAGGSTDCRSRSSWQRPSCVYLHLMIFSDGWSSGCRSSPAARVMPPRVSKRCATPSPGRTVCSTGTANGSFERSASSGGVHPRGGSGRLRIRIWRIGHRWHHHLARPQPHPSVGG